MVAPLFRAGTLTVQIAGLASNADANVTVSSGGVSQLVTSSQTLSLTPGQYTVSAEPVLTGQSVMGPTAPNQQVTVAAGQTATVTVSYNTLRALALRLVEVIGGGLDQPILSRLAARGHESDLHRRATRPNSRVPERHAARNAVPRYLHASLDFGRARALFVRVPSAIRG